ncbi:MAG TPA: antibiotic biosynthesis monooxygenase family protein [Candidatus Binatia bacterium]|jgi:heme-degrading monooxygenase HmoA|nr:antibiotic biosynthesis monooxygenase family protein [Candidatus Binatia bacterium]
MIHEIVIQHVQPEKRDEYIKVFGEILTKANYPGSYGIKFFTSIEDPSRVILMIEWDSVEAHTQHRGTPTHNAMREATSKYQTAKSDGAHFLMHEVMR